MKFIINGDKLKIEQAETINSGSFKDYLMPVEYDESWNNLNIEAIIAQDKSEQGVSRAVVNNQVYIDVSKKKRYTIGFIGYTIENNQKIRQKTTDLKILPIIKGAGEITPLNTEEIPTESEWEIYLNQIDEFITNGNEIINEANNLDLDIQDDTLIITKKDGTTKEVVVGEGQSDKNYIHRQDVASNEWNIVHNLDKYPSVSIVDSSGNKVVGDVEYLSANNLKIKFSSAFSGKAYLN